MSESYINKILLKPKKYNPYSHMKPAVKDSNFYFTNCITFNMMENLTQFKNKEISTTNLNLRLISNLSFLFANKNITTKKIHLKKKQKLKNSKSNKNIININDNEKEETNFGILEGYESYIPTKRIPYFNKRALNEKALIRKESSKLNRKKEKIPPNLRNINFFRPTGRFMIYKTQNQFYSSKFITIPNKPRKISNNNMNISDLYSEVLSNSIVHTNTNTEDLYDYNDFSVDFSYIAGDIDDNIFHEKSFINSLKTIPTFPKYSELCELIECPFDDALPPDLKYKKYINVFTEFLNEEDNYDDNNNTNPNNNNNNDNNNGLDNSIINISQDTNDDNINNENNNNKKAFIINPSKTSMNNSDKNRFFRTSSRSGKLLKVNANIFSNYNSSIINKTSLSDDYEDIDDYEKDESIFAFFENDEDKKKNPSKKINPKIKKMLPKSAIKYVNKMSNQYIFLMYEKYKIVAEKWEEAKKYLCDDIMLKKWFIQILKRLLLNIGISSKKFYEKLIKFETYKKKSLDFEHFMSIFELILIEENKENLRFKFFLLLKIISNNDDNDQILTEKEMNLFFDLIGCENIYINNFCEILGERLILRYKGIYNNGNLDKNMIDKNFIYRKLKIILESFLDALDS